MRKVSGTPARRSSATCCAERAALADLVATLERLPAGADSEAIQFDLYEAGKVTYEDALRNADSVNDLRLQIKLNSQRVKTMDLAAGTEHLTIV